MLVQVWDRDLWIRTETDATAYADKFRPAEQLYAACIEPRSEVDCVVTRNNQEITRKFKAATAAAKTAETEKKRYQDILDHQALLFASPEPSETDGDDSNSGKMNSPGWDSDDERTDSSTAHTDTQDSSSVQSLCAEEQWTSEDKLDSSVVEKEVSDIGKDGEYLESDFFAQFSGPGDNRTAPMHGRPAPQNTYSMHDTHAFDDDTDLWSAPNSITSDDGDRSGSNRR